MRKKKMIKSTKTVKIEIIKEKNKLDSKIEKLKSFTLSVRFLELNIEQIRALHKQLSAMENYSIALRDRIIDIAKQDKEQRK